MKMTGNKRQIREGSCGSEGMGGRKEEEGGAPHASTPLSGSSEIKTRHDALDKSLAASSLL